MLELRNIQKSFGRKRVLESLSLDIRDGELFTLLGESGCGKTTLLRIIAGLESADSGTILRDGEAWLDASTRRWVPPQRRNVGFVFQSYAIWPHLKVFDQVAYPLRNRRKAPAEIRRRVAEALSLVGLDGLEHRHAAQLSGGQQQRVAMARAIVAEPSLLLLDEPFSNLDAKLREQLRQELRTLQSKLGLTIILVTHDQADAFALSDRIAVMRDGVIEQVATAEDLYGTPKSDFVRNFVGRSFGLRLPAGTEARLGRAVPAHTSSQAAGADDGLVWLRPEDIEIGVPDATPDGFVGTIVSRQFLGDRYECQIVLPDGQELHAYHRRGWQLPSDGRVGLHLLGFVPPSLPNGN